MSEIILYTSPDGVAKVEVFFEDENFWLTQRRMAELFGVSVPTINEHLATIFESGELDREATYLLDNNVLIFLQWGDPHFQFGGIYDSSDCWFHNQNLQLTSSHD